MSTPIYRGDVYWFAPHKGFDLLKFSPEQQADLLYAETPQKCRPYVVVTTTKNNANGTKLFLVPLTSQPQRGGPLSPQVCCDGKDAWANVLDLISVNKDLLDQHKFICQLNKEEIASIEWALAQVLGMHRPRNDS